MTKPHVIIGLGATAAQSLLGKQFRVSKQRCKPVQSELASTAIATVHPSSVRRAALIGYARAGLNSLFIVVVFFVVGATYRAIDTIRGEASAQPLE